jgi:hypothetical protein
MRLNMREIGQRGMRENVQLREPNKVAEKRCHF